MNELDYVLLGVLAISGLMALWRGFLREALGLLGWVAAFVAAARFSEELARHLDQWIEPPILTDRLSFFAIFVATLVLFGMLGQLLKKFFGLAGLSVADRLLGLCFGLARGSVILAITLVMYQHLFYPQHAPSDHMARSTLLPYLVQGTDWAMQTLPPSWRLPRAAAPISVAPANSGEMTSMAPTDGGATAPAAP